MNGKQLIMFITRTSVHVAEVLCSNGEIIRSASKSFETLNESNSKELLNTFFTDLNWTETYEEYSLSWISPIATLVPSRIFEASEPLDLINLVVGKKIDKNEVDYNRIAELDMVNVYDIPHWVKSFFILKYPKIAIFHDYTVRIRSLFKESTYKPSVAIHVYPEQFMLLIANKQQLVFANQFDFQTKEDIAYYLSYSLQQQGLLHEKGTINATALTKEGVAILNDLFQMLNAKKIVPKFTLASTALAFKNQLVCA